MLAEQGDMIGAIRLPKGAFPDTQVVTDIIYMRKRLPNEQPGDQSWLDTDKFTLEITDKDYYGRETTRAVEDDVNRYFTQHPNMILGTQSFQGSMHGADEYTVEMDKDKPLAEVLQKAIGGLPPSVVKDAVHTEVVRSAPLPSPMGMREGSRMVVEDGSIKAKRGGYLETLTGLSVSDVSRLEG